MTILEVKHFTVGYTEPVVQDVSFALEPGQVVGLLGRNGCGKTTLLRGLCGSARVLGGTAEIQGQNCLALKPKQLARRIALLPQRTRLLQGLQAGEVICMGRYAYGGLFAAPGAETEKIARQAARSLGIEHLWNEDCAALSEGQRQLVNLARVTAQDAVVLLLDEPSSALDYQNSHLLFRKVQQLACTQKRAVLVVLHDPALALRWCDELLCMEEGRVTGTLRPAEAEPEQAQQFLSRLYPDIRVSRDEETSQYYCLMD